MQKNQLELFFDLVIEHQNFNIKVEKVESKEGDGIILYGKRYPYYKFHSIDCNGAGIDLFSEKIRKQTDKTIHYIRKIYAKYGEKAKFFLSNDLDAMQLLIRLPEWSIKETETSWIIRAQNKQPFTSEIPFPEDFVNFINECIDIMDRYIQKIQYESGFLERLVAGPKKKSKNEIEINPF